MNEIDRDALVAGLIRCVTRLPEERVIQLLELDDDELLALLQGQETSAAPTPKQTAHESICIPFTINWEQFEAVGFLRQGEVSCLGEEALRRCDNGHLVRKEADWRLLYENRAQLPTELQKYWLATARPDPDYPRLVSRLAFDSGVWYGNWHDLGGQWVGGLLVVRRRVSSPA